MNSCGGSEGDRGPLLTEGNVINENIDLCYVSKITINTDLLFIRYCQMRI